MSLFPLGLISQGGGGGGGGAAAYELISTAYGTGSSGVITFSAIPQTYKHLQIRAVHANNGGLDNLYLRLNGNSGTNYQYHILRGLGSSIQSEEGGAGSSQIFTGWTSNVANTYSTSIIDILDYTSTSKNRTTRTLHGIVDGSVNQVWLSSGLYLSTVAVSSISLSIGNFSFTNASRFSLYGVKG